MNTMSGKNEALSSVLFGKSRRAVLSLLFMHTDESFYLRQISRLSGVGLGPLQRELKNLEKGGIILRRVSGRQVYYQANKSSPVFSELEGLVIKTAGVVDVLRASLSPLSDRIKFSFIYGSFAKGREKRVSDVDLLVVGEASFSEVVKALEDAQKVLGREINPTVYPLDEFQSKISRGHHFLDNVLRGERIMLTGDNNELERLAKERVGG
jgi:predicted nucleotidyltransferase